MNDGFPAAIISLYKEAKNGINTSAVKKETRTNRKKKSFHRRPTKSTAAVNVSFVQNCGSSREKSKKNGSRLNAFSGFLFQSSIKLSFSCFFLTGSHILALTLAMIATRCVDSLDRRLLLVRVGYLISLAFIGRLEDAL